MRYVPALDGIRAIAAAAVMAFHAWIPGAKGGFLGVDVFFVLSGYLITSILLQERQRTGHIDLGRFYLRRVRRLYPALLLLLVVCVGLGPFLWSKYTVEWHLGAGAIAGLYLSDYAWAVDFPMRHLAHTWSLAVEEQFYLLWPLILLGLVRLSRRAMTLALVGAYVLLSAWRWHEWLLGRLDHGVYYSLDTHSAGLILGCIVAVARPKVSAWVGWAALGVLFACFGTFELFTDAAMISGITVAEFASVLVILAPPSILAAAPLVWLGKVSYGLYLWHYPIMRLLRDMDFSPATTLLVGAIVTVPLAALSHRTIEAYFRAQSTSQREPTPTYSASNL